MACGDDDGGSDGGADSGVDSGVDSGGGTDSGVDAGEDTGVDASMGCEVDCELEELSLGSGFGCARRANGEVLCWGANRFGQLGDGRMGHADCTGVGGVEREDCSPEPVPVVDVVATQLSSNGGINTCGLQADGTVYCWGLSDIPPPGSDQRSRLFFPEELEGFTASPMAVTTRNGNTCMITATGTGECFGVNDSGQVGNDSFAEQVAPVAVSTVTGIVELDYGSGEFACARTADAVYCWGSNRSGQLGDGTIGIGTHGTCGELGREFDCASTPQEAIVINDTVTVAQMDLGLEHACVVTTEGELYCWGNNDAGSLGTGDNAGTATPAAVAGITDAAEVALGTAHTCVRSTAGAVQCWGANDEGQIGDGLDVGAHDTCTFFDTTFDCVLSPTAVTLPQPAVAIAAGGDNTCALLDDNTVWCWGWNERRQLGTEDRERRTAPVQVLGFE